MKKFFALLTLLTLVLSMTVGSFAAENNKRGNNPSVSQGVLNMTVGSVLEDGQNRAEINGDKPKKAEREAFKAEFADEFLALEVLRATCKTNWTTIKGLNESIKAEIETLRQEIKALGKDVAPGVMTLLNEATAAKRSAIEALRTDIRSLQEAKKTAWAALKAAVKAKDQPAAQAAINKILEKKGEIIAKQGQMILLKRDLLGILTGFTVVAPPAAPAI